MSIQKQKQNYKRKHEEAEEEFETTKYIEPAAINSLKKKAPTVLWTNWQKNGENSTRKWMLKCSQMFKLEKLNDRVKGAEMQFLCKNLINISECAFGRKICYLNLIIAETLSVF